MRCNNHPRVPEYLHMLPQVPLRQEHLHLQKVRYLPLYRFHQRVMITERSRTIPFHNNH